MTVKELIETLSNLTPEQQEMQILIWGRMVPQEARGELKETFYYNFHPMGMAPDKKRGIMIL